MRAYLFPGQGAQAIGMGRDVAEAYPEARRVFEEVDDALGEKLSELIWNGDIRELTLTQNAQPALMTASIAVVRALEKEGARINDAAFVAGHSLGEYSALCAAGAIELADTARLLRKRGIAMQEAVEVGKGAMAAILGLSLDDVVAIARDASANDVCEAANDNDPAQVVISGHAAAVERAMQLAKERKAKRAMPLPVSAPFHCSLMEPAEKAMAQPLADTQITRPGVPIVSNVTATETSEPDEIRQRLIDQITRRVRWRQSVDRMAQSGVDDFVELGAGRALTGMVRRIVKGSAARAVGSAEDVAEFVRAVGAR